MLSAAARNFAYKRQVVAPLANFGLRSLATSVAGTLDQFDEYGGALFTGKVADEYLKKHGATADILKDPTWVRKHADKVADALFDWALDNGASVYTHWFQPMGASGVRHGLTGQVHNAMLKFDKNNKVVKDFKGKTLVRGETDGSSYPSGGLRATHQAGGYLAIDTSSPIFLRGDTIFIPSVFVSYYGAALDEKTPVLRSNAALNKHGSRLLEKLGLNCSSGIVSNIGLEQEFFLVPRSQYYRRPDLQFTGRTVMGATPARGQEMSDHYMAPLSSSTEALACMQEVQEECWRMGIPLKTRHREVAPNQFEFAPLYGLSTGQIDQNIMVMQVLEEVAARHNLAALLQEKPFATINGSGKHNNWSLWTGDGVNLLEPGSLGKASGNKHAFPIVMAAVISAIDEHGDLMRAAISSPGNDFRLGACEAPPAIVSTYLGHDMTEFLEGFMNGSDIHYEPHIKTIDLGTREVVPFQVPSEDRNRTSPFPYGGARFEFRAVGSSQNVGFVNTVLNSMVADKFAELADKIDAGGDPVQIARDTLKKHFKVVFNGDNYELDNQQMLTDRGLWRIDSGVEALARLTADKNIALFEKMKVLSSDECHARQNVYHDHYTGTVEIEAKTMASMIETGIIPAIKKAGVGPLKELESLPAKLEAALHEIHDAADSYEKAKLSRVLRLETMVDMRAICDEAEQVCPADLWPFATYKELLFLDQHTTVRSSSPYDDRLPTPYDEQYE